MDSIVHFLNGAVSGMFGVSISHPIDTIKTNVQDRKPISYRPSSLYRGVGPALTGVGFEKAIVFGTYENSRRILNRYSSNDRLNIAVSGALSGFTASLVVAPTERFKILRQIGHQIGLADLHPTVLFRGLSATFTREVPGFAIYFSTYEYFKQRSESKTGKQITLSSAFVYGGLSGALAWAGIYPQDVVKTRMQANDTSRNLNFRQTVSQIYREGGSKAFFKGFHLALIRAVPLHAGTFSMMEIMKRYNTMGN